MSHVFAAPDDPAQRADGRSRSQRRGAFYWRFVGTAICFAVFGLGALLLSVTLLPLLRMLPAARCQHLSRAGLRRGMRTFVRLMCRLGVLTYDFQGVERLGRPGQLIVANHPSLIDVVFLIAFTPQANCVVKHAMFRNLLTRSVLSASGYISNELTADMIERAAAALQQGQCLIMFPEGTRSSVGQPLALHRGAANVAVRAAAAVTPVYIRCEPVTLTKGQPWYRIPTQRPHFTLVAGEDIDLSVVRGMKSIPLASRAFNEQLRRNFECELQRLDGYTGAACGAACDAPGCSSLDCSNDPGVEPVRPRPSSDSGSQRR